MLQVNRTRRRLKTTRQRHENRARKATTLKNDDRGAAVGTLRKFTNDTARKRHVNKTGVRKQDTDAKGNGKVVRDWGNDKIVCETTRSLVETDDPQKGNEQHKANQNTKLAH